MVVAIFAVMVVTLASMMFNTAAPPTVVAVTIPVHSVSIPVCIAGANIRSRIVIGLRVPCPYRQIATVIQGN